MATADFEKCGALLHSWEPMAPPMHHNGRGDMTLFMACTRCGSEKVMDIDANGYISYSKIIHSEPYRKWLDDNSMNSRADHRLAVHRRTYGRRRRRTAA